MQKCEVIPSFPHQHHFFKTFILHPPSMSCKVKDFHACSSIERDDAKALLKGGSTSKQQAHQFLNPEEMLIVDFNKERRKIIQELNTKISLANPHRHNIIQLLTPKKHPQQLSPETTQSHIQQINSIQQTSAPIQTTWEEVRIMVSRIISTYLLLSIFNNSWV